MARTVGIGIQDFATIIKENCFYVDKSDFISEWWDSKDSVTLITRPRRFGKTLNMSMVEQFFSIDYANRGDLFEGLSIWEKEEYRELQGTYPVISLSFANVKERDYKSTKDRICQLITDLYIRNAFLRECDWMTTSDKEFFDSVRTDMPEVMVEPESFQNDLAEIHSKDDALTALIHLGYLGYDADRKSAYIPYYEVAKAFQMALKTGEWSEISKTISRCDELLMATIDGNADKVAEIIELAHETYTSVLTYNDENSLSCVLTMAYFTAPAYYEIIREHSTSKGYADFIFKPRANAGWRPAMVVELKYNKSAHTAIKQIKEKRYQGALSDYSDKILLVGINYDAEGKDSKKHTCVIEEWKD